MTPKKRLDTQIQQLYPSYSRSYVQSLIMQGKVHVDGTVVTKSGALVTPENLIEIIGEMKAPFVSRAGLKLEHALTTFAIDVQGKIALDAGISTGGFTDCLLQHGIAKVYGVDVGYGQLHEKIRNDPRVVVMERTNLRHLRDVGEQVDIVTLDLSFISLIKVMDAVAALLKPGGILITLIKPQFEAGKEAVGKGGIVKDPKVHEEVVERVTTGIASYGFTLQGVTTSPIEGTQGNKEFLASFIHGA